MYSEWYVEITSLDKLSTYRTFKTNLDPERYLTVNVYDHRVMLSRLRCSSHALRIETDRKNDIVRNERLCTLCNLHEIEDEYHFVLICSFFTTFRDKYIPFYYFNPPLYEKFVELMSSENQTILKRLSAFLYHALKLRSDINNDLV